MSGIKFDKEYSCTWYTECKYLMDHGIKYTFVKEQDGVVIWKFKKNSYLFKTLSEFYEMVYTN